jgi:natural product biosynthesis luciferase-like monooxygenase protein
MSRFSSIVVGAESLAIQCAEILLERGHTIAAFVTRAPELRAFAEARGLRVERPGPDLAARLADLEVDYLFSIANLTVLPEPVLARARRGAVNFHDGPLPRYAGLYCTSWALMSRERTHGVRWHLMEGGIDEGDVLAGRDFELASNETALTLNAKCYASGMESFRELVERIEAGTVERTKQDLAQRTYFARHDRPAALATIDWSKDAESIAALVRALDFGSYPNPLAIAKTRALGSVVLVRSIELEDAPVEKAAPGTLLPGTSPPGTVLSVCSVRGPLVMTGTTPVRLTSMSDADGRPLAPSRFEPGLVLASWSTELAERASALHREVGVQERAWIQRLRVDALDLAWAEPATATPRWETLPLPWPSALRDERRLGALLIALARLGGHDTTRVGLSEPALRARIEGLEELFASVVPVVIAASGTVSEVEARLARELDHVRAKVTFARDLAAREPGLGPSRPPFVVSTVPSLSREPQPLGALVTFELAPGGARMFVDGTRLDADGRRALEGRLLALLDGIASDSSKQVFELPLVSEAERHHLAYALNDTGVEYPRECIHRLFEAQVDRTPDAVALVFEDRSLTYRELDRRASQLAHRLRREGVVPGTIVGLLVERSLELVIGVLGIQKAGGAYLPLDPTYPADRVALMIEDSRAPLVLTEAHLAGVLEGHAARAVRIDDPTLGSEDASRLEGGATPEDLAYVIYTSGSTGRPKGVMVEHRNVASFFAGMDRVIDPEKPGVWLAVTSLSFDISVLELLWTTSRGFRVVLYRDRRAERSDAPIVSTKPMDFGLCYWGNDDRPGRGKYRLLLEGAKFADQHGFHAVWTPERHFHAFGGPYANPSVSGAAVAAVTQNLHIRAASCVLPLHHPVRVAEEWAMIDNLSDGRVGLGIAAGWQPDDFILRPENAPPKSKSAMFRDIEVLRRLWRGEAVEFPRADGSMHAVVTQPRPVQAEVPIWLTIALNPESYQQAADIGANVLTHLLGQSIDELAGKIRLYRDRLAELGKDPSSGKVTLMLHTFVAEDREEARDVTRGPLKSYLASAASLIKQYVWMFPALKRPHGADAPENIDLATLDADEMDAILDFAFTRYFEDSGLLGSVDDCVRRVEQLKAIGVDEIACLVDYGVDGDVMLASLTHLAEVVKRTSRPSVEADHSFATQVERHGVTHLQCTPSMARMLLSDEGSRAALARIQHLFLGGEALPLSLARELRAATSARIQNMYGPTETTVWSSTDRVEPDEGVITLGRPIANTRLYVLDEHRQLVPEGVPGELYIGGDAVVRGYLFREELTHERFVPDPFHPGARMYRTGDLARVRSDGRIEFLGRVDHQVKVRGYRIELGEIEARACERPDVREAVVVAREREAGELELVAYVTAAASSTGKSGVDVSALRERLEATLPPYMVPSRFVTLERLPLTPNGKIDRKALPAPDAVAAAASSEPYVAPDSDLEQRIAEVWREVLGIPQVGRNDNFFELGGHSLLAVRLHRELGPRIERPLTLTDIFRFPTVRALAEHLEDGGASGNAKLSAIAERAAARRGPAPTGGGSTRRLVRRT